MFFLYLWSSEYVLYWIARNFTEWKIKLKFKKPKQEFKPKLSELELYWKSTMELKPKPKSNDLELISIEIESLEKGRQEIDDRKAWLKVTLLGQEDIVSSPDGKTIKWRLNNWQDSSAKYGKCEVCGEHVSEVFGQHALIEYELNRFTFHESPESLVGHKECLLKARENISSPEPEPEPSELELLRLEIETLEKGL